MSAPLSDTLRLILTDGGPGQCIFPINNACNAACGFCSFNRDDLPRSDWKFADLEGSKKAADILYANGIHYLIITGGEPMMHPNLHEICAHAAGIGMTVLLVTNGSLLNPDSCRKLKENGVSSIFISIDSHDTVSHEENRGLPKVLERIKTANAEFARLGVQSTASVTMSRLIKDYEKLPDFLESLGFTAVTFSYPLVHLGSSFLGYSDSDLVKLSNEDLDAAFRAVDSLRRRFTVINPTASIEDMRSLLQGRPQSFDCLAGFKYFYLDWDLQIWRCHHWETPIGSIFDFDASKRVRDGCQKCMIDCMRDPSVMQHAAVALTDSLAHVRGGRFSTAAKTMFSRKTATSVAASAGQWRWIMGL